MCFPLSFNLQARVAPNFVKMIYIIITNFNCENECIFTCKDSSICTNQFAAMLHNQANKHSI